jgi:4-amino-4-deoxy-L-arabinose transferase-like glycosyltransferase
LTRISVIAVVICAALLHFYRLDEVPVYISTDEARFAVQAHSIATTGRDLRGNRLPMFVLIVDPFLPKEQSPAWWQPTLFYALAATFQFTGVSEWSTRAPIAILAVINVWLMFIVARRWFSSAPLGLFAAAALAMTPAHLILGRESADYFCPTTIALLWVWSLLRLIERPDARAGVLTGAVLGAGLYTYITSWVVMPMYLALTIAVMYRTRPAFSVIRSMVVAFLCCIIPVAIWLAMHPGMPAETFANYKVAANSQLLERITLFWDYFNPSYLFFAGASNMMWSTRTAGVFLLPFGLLLPIGLWYLLTRRRSPAGFAIVIAFVLVPLPIVAAMPEAPFYATARAILAIPFGVLIATAGLAWLLEGGSRIRIAVACAAIALMPLQFARFAQDYFTDYRVRSAPWIDVMNIRGVADYLIANDATNPAPAIYLSHDDMAEDKAVKWKFHLLSSSRLDLWERSKYLESDEAVAQSFAPGSVLLLGAANPRIAGLQRDGWVVETVIEDVTGSPRTAVLRRR